MAGGVYHAPENAHHLGATAFALFTRNQRQWTAKPYPQEDIDAFKKNLTLYGYAPRHILPHAGYLINLGNPDPVKRERSFGALLDEIGRCSQLGLTMLNLHPGSSLKLISVDECIGLIADSINAALAQTKGVSLVLENTAGQGSNLGRTFEELAAIMEQVEDPSRIGVCFDTCHAYAAGYALDTNEEVRETFDAFDRIIGMHYLRGLHLNGSKHGRGSRKDRHASLGEGLLPMTVMEYIMKDARFDDLPLILETTDEERWASEITQLYQYNPSSKPDQ